VLVDAINGSPEATPPDPFNPNQNLFAYPALSNLCPLAPALHPLILEIKLG
jgi:hypothetical protein